MKMYSSINRVVMRKISSSKIFDLSISSSYKEVSWEGVDLSSLNKKISRYFLGGTMDMEELANGGHIRMSTFYNREHGVDVWTRKYIINFFPLQYSISISTGSLSGADLDQVLDLGLYLSKYKKIQKWKHI